MIWNAVLLALRAIRRNALRSLLTVLGIVIGVAAVIIVVTLGGGATLQVTQQIEALGTNMLIIRSGQRLGPGMSSTAPQFTKEDAIAIGREIGGVTAVAPSSTQGVTAIYNNKNWSTAATGVDNEYFKVRNWPLGSGRLFTPSELRAGKSVCIIGATVARELFGANDPLGANIRLEKVACEVIGVLDAKGQSTMGTDQDDLVLVPLHTFQRRIAGNTDVKVIQLSVTEGGATEKVQREVERLMRERRHLSGNEENNFNIMDMKEITSMLTGTTEVMTALLGAVGAVSLLVGGIGIMNIMLVSVTERTREIGVRLAIGALARDVLLQFLVEAVVLSSLGGVLGIVVALLGAVGLGRLMHIPFVFNGSIIVIAFLFSAAVGVVFGFVPARKAARLNPIEALRYE